MLLLTLRTQLSIISRPNVKTYLLAALNHHPFMRDPRVPYTRVVEVSPDDCTTF